MNYDFYKKLPYWLLASFMVVVLLVSCVKEYEVPQEATKELLVSTSQDFAVAEGTSVTFTDLSLGVKSRKWTFPSGTPETSTAAAANVVFSSESTESVIVNPTLEVTYYDGTTETKTLNITVYPVLSADFTVSATKIKVGESVTFSDASIGGADNYEWEFIGASPSTPTSTAQNPTVTFNSNEPVTVILTITRNLDESTVSIQKTNLVQVGPYELDKNGDFESGVIGIYQQWNGGGFPLLAVPGGALNSNYAMAFDIVPGANGSLGPYHEIFSRDDPNNRIEVQNGKQYTLSGYVKADAPGVNMELIRGVNHRPSWSGACGGCVTEGYSEYYPVSGSSFPVILTNQWQKVSVVVEIPNDANTRTNFYAQFLFRSTVNTRVYLDKISVKEVEN